MANFVESSVGIQNCVMIMMEICMAFEMMLILLRVTRFEGLKRIILTVILFAKKIPDQIKHQSCDRTHNQYHRYIRQHDMSIHPLSYTVAMVILKCRHHKK